MKKAVISIITIILTVSLAVPFFSVTTGAYSRGDLNGDGKINAVDSHMMTSVILGGDGVTKLALLMGDLDSDNKINTIDLNMLNMCFIGKLSLSPSYEVGTVTVSGTDLSEYSIECPADADTCMKYAATALKDHIGNACGLYLPIVEKANGHAIRLVLDPTADGENAGVLGEQGYRIVTDSKGVTIYGGIYSGCMNGVYDFLDKYFNYAFYYNPGISLVSQYGGSDSRDTASRYVYSANHISLENIDDTHTPAIVFRNCTRSLNAQSPALHYNAYIYYNNDTLREKYGCYKLIEAASHGLTRCNFYTEEEMEANGWGSAAGKQPCFNDPDVIATVTKRALASLDERAAAGQIIGKDYCTVDVAQIDVVEFCQCRLCVKDRRDTGTYTGSVVKFANKIDNAIQARPEYRGKVFTNILAYTLTAYPPSNIKPNDNVMISFCFYFFGWENGICSNHPLSDKTCPYNEMFTHAFEGWKALTDNLTVWYYPLQYYYLCNTSQYTFNIYDDFKYFYENGVYGVYVDGTQDKSTFGWLDFQLMQKMSWDADITREEFNDYIKELLFLMYGDGYEYVWDYLVIKETAADLCPGDKGDGHTCFFGAAPMKKMNLSYYKEMLPKSIECYSKAYEMAATQEQKDAVDVLFMHMWYIGCGVSHTDMWKNGTVQTRAEYKKMLDFFVANSERAGCAIAEDKDSLVDEYISPDKVVDYDINPFEWMIEIVDPTNRVYQGWKSDYNY